ncbi:hypothetical protein I6A60_12720 [Frankia sp. AgB1.9]|uniref:hypothetical protein n=1 Tax=unclassified Frankia TaxID=2632575 RepID=UPI001933CD1D|nr:MULTISPECIES: hypothetical protein [unclassified Frankia]MBL7492580.1 hypothetical protein [Frankia sp. AgW1.1]MBL7548733.1 hypothetical protein [Frankia sp. AgB1.9]MBL7619331.1 hypothetical protein [Frankia sp. AgB1.8]
MELTEEVHPGMSAAELAAEQAELLPERITLMMFQNGQSVGTGNNSPASGAASNSVISGNSSMVQTIGNTGSCVHSLATGSTYTNQR